MRRYVWFHHSTHKVHLVLPLQDVFYWQHREMFQSLMGICHIMANDGLDFVPKAEPSMVMTVQHPGETSLSNYHAFVATVLEGDVFMDRVRTSPADTLTLLIELTAQHNDRFFEVRTYKQPATESFITQLGG